MFSAPAFRFRTRNYKSAQPLFERAFQVSGVVVAIISPSRTACAGTHALLKIILLFGNSMITVDPS